MVSSSDSTTANNMCEWITITAPNTIHDSNANVGQAWLAALQALVTRKKCDGFQNCHWGRVTEDDTQLFIWTSWANKTAYDLYAGGDAHRLVYEQLDQVSSTPIVTRLIMYDSTVSYARFSLSKYWPSITIMYFDRPLTESRRRELRKIGVMNSSHAQPWQQTLFKRGPVARRTPTRRRYPGQSLRSPGLLEQPGSRSNGEEPIRRSVSSSTRRYTVSAKVLRG
jgi:hypothetical protein